MADMSTVLLLWRTERHLYETELLSKQEENFTSLAEARENLTWEH